ncbi:TIM-barrel domain-containing protein [Roseitranquillus sediminis]|uniref:TIM-barrel domain-containing protein n=1 Tax=Roseitranquillus sediminis TaxID=2809051 RepID=UPI001D0CB531|nr:TIM-barrel domain-containing protein [Roseitranquillus sediminis]MBM9594212.1 DUF5110 domain-containing protein [Roseitranquillus sediminis]
MFRITLPLITAGLVCAGMPVPAQVERMEVRAQAGSVVVEVLDDDLMRFEVQAGPPAEEFYASPMIQRRDFPGADLVAASDDLVATSELSARVDAANLCIRLDHADQGYLTTICPVDLGRAEKGLDIDPGRIDAVYGLGQQFRNPGSADGDWTALGVRRGEGLLGNGFAGFQDAAVGNVQIPVLHALGDGVNYALLLDNVYRQTWDFTAFWWQARMFGDALRFYVMTGPDLPDLRADYMELTGRPPVPPRKAFGLWVSEFGYDGWDEIDVLRDGLRAAGFPLDGFVLDLNWFGGVVPSNPSASEMGRLDWDEDQEPRLARNPYFFPDPAERVAAYAADGIGLVAIEESYIADTTPTFTQMPPELTAYQRRDGRCDPAHQLPVVGVAGFWGVGRMIDWSDPAAGAWIHSARRSPNLGRLGITSHWTDLGEPETYDPAACYEGVEPGKVEHPDVHNLYNLLWNRAIWNGYAAEARDGNGPSRRPFIVTRSGAAGTQRYGTAMWSGDIASNLESLATHLNAQMHMSMSGIDYYGSDIGGFRRETMPGNDRRGSYRGYQDELYTQWFANGAWFDVPVRPHTDNEFVVADPPYATAPHLVGDVASNLANIRQRYELIPYYYSLAYRAHLHGEPVVPPVVFHFPDDPAVRRMGHEKMIGDDLLVAVIARHGEYERDVYLPEGRWVNFHSNEWHDGGMVPDVPAYRDGLFLLPVFARAGAILPMMHVGEAPQDAFGASDELVLRVYAGAEPSAFTLYEDDGRSLRYDADGRPLYHYRTTELTQRTAPATALVEIGAAEDVGGAGSYDGAATHRSVLIELVVDGMRAEAVRLDGEALPEVPEAEIAAGAEGWANAERNLVLARLAAADVRQSRSVAVDVAPISPATSLNFVCDRGFTVPGESVYVSGSLPALGDWDPLAAVKLAPSIYHDYIVSPPAGGIGPGPQAPVWTGVVGGLPPFTAFEWKCIRRREDGMGPVEWQLGGNNTHETAGSGYSGRAYGSF